MRFGMSLVSAFMATTAIVCPYAASAETLPEAMQSAIEGNPSLAAARARVTAIRQELPLAWSEALPQISLSGSANQNNRSEQSPFATTVRERPDYWIASVNTSTLLFGGGRVWASTREARGRIANAIANYQGTAQQLLLDVATAYAGVIAARETKDAQQQSLENLEEQLRYVQANVEHGFLTQTDLAQARARVAQARANLTQADLQLVQASEAYTRLVGHPPGDLSLPPDISGLPSDLEAAINYAGDNSPTLLAAMAAVETADASVDVAASQGRVRMSIDTTNSFFETMNRANDTDATEDNVSLRVSVPLFSGGSIRAQTRQRRANRTAARFDLADVQLEVRERVTIAWSALHAARATVEAQEARLEAADIAQRGMQREQQAGLRSTIDVLNQEEELLSARVGLARAQRDMVVAQRELAAAVGNLNMVSFDDVAMSQRAIDPRRTGRERREEQRELTPLREVRADVRQLRREANRMPRHPRPVRVSSAETQLLCDR
ncbi:MAG: TolC family outer membrane protein [Hyphomonadaceae bacterium]